ncbi:PorV/PorQ family protein [Aurantibacillus circumpalustris]|uniref:putative type IX sorting system protein PorV2 n=1 Tax=Aurantibacillus circumpalustris TaxID=3036359 RepID=UPI00295B89E5|nr:PorV/PorQ family protein [Aurantibacillus circumpalustris]
MYRLLPVLILFISLGYQAQTRKYSNEFLNIGVGARALGMGNANIASADGVSAGYWNPAGLLSQKNDIEVGLMHAEYFAGIAKYDFIGASKRIDSNSVAGFSILRFGVDNIPNTLELVDANGNVDYDRVSTFNAVDFAALLSYARSIPKLKGVELGGNFKIIRRKLGPFGGAWGFGLDAGAKYTTKGWTLAAMARDVTGTFNAWSFNLDDKQKATLLQTGNEIPSSSTEITAPKLILGITKTFKVWKERVSIQGEVDFINTFDGMRNTVINSEVWSMEPAVGLELGYKGFIYLRGGIGNIQKQLNDRATLYVTTFQPNFGVGVKYKIFTLDYALTDIGDRSIAIYSNIFSLKIDINKKMNK